MSAILKVYKTLQWKVSLLTTSGILCVPFFCFGCICLVPSATYSEFKNRYEKVIRLYGGKKPLKQLGKMVANENEIFRNTISFVNRTYENPSDINPNINLLDIICEMNPSIKSILTSSWVGKYSKEYVKTLYEHYIENCGNYHIIVYGLIEYLCTQYDPTCIKIEDYLNRFVSNGALYLECMDHKQYVFK
jgi:hypothetical protein